MIIVMKADASPEQVGNVAKQVESLGLKPHVIEGSERTVVAVVGDEQDATVSAMETVPGVARVLPILAPYKVASREVQQEQTVVTVGPLVATFVSSRDHVRLSLESRFSTRLEQSSPLGQRVFVVVPSSQEQVPTAFRGSKKKGFNYLQRHAMRRGKQS